MDQAEILPDFLVRRHHARRAGLTPEEHAKRSELVRKGQSPAAMIIACCDSRVSVADVFGPDMGEFFVHRNIANLVPPCTEDGSQHGTSATIEFAVTVLGVRHVVVMGHSSCGGVAGCYDAHSGGSASLGGFTAAWLDILAPSVAPIASQDLDREDAHRALEYEAVLVSLRNLMTFPFVREAVEKGALTLHGAWRDIGDASMRHYDPASGKFVPV